MSDVHEIGAGQVQCNICGGIWTVNRRARHRSAHERTGGEQVRDRQPDPEHERHIVYFHSIHDRVSALETEMSATAFAISRGVLRRPNLIDRKRIEPAPASPHETEGRAKKRTLGEELRDLQAHPSTPALLPTLQQPSPELQAMLDKATDEQGLPRVAAFAEPAPPKAPSPSLAEIMRQVIEDAVQLPSQLTCTFCGQKFARGANHECSDHVIATRKENDELREKIAELGASQSGLLEALKQIVERGASASLARRIAWKAVRAVEPEAFLAAQTSEVPGSPPAARPRPNVDSGQETAPAGGATSPGTSNDSQPGDQKR